MAKTKECPSCAMEVDASSRVCPICKYEFSENRSWITWVAVILLIVFLLYFII